MKRIGLFLMVGLMLFMNITSITTGTSIPVINATAVSANTSIFSTVFYDSVTAFVKCNPNRGEVVVLNTFPSINGVSAFVASIDPEHSRYFQPVIDNSFTERLLIINTLTGEILADPPFSTTLSALQYNSRNNYLYGTAYDFDLRSTVLIRIDPDTMEQTVVLALPEVIGVLSGVSALDIEHNQYFFVGRADGEDKVYKINIQTKEAATVPITTTHSINHFEFDPSDGTLISVGWFPNADGQQLDQQLVRINVETGEIRAIASLPEISALYQAASVFDPIENLYIFPVIDPNGIPRLFIFDTETGELVADPELVVVPGSGSLSALSLRTTNLSFTGQFKSFEARKVFLRVYLPLIMR